MLMWKFHFNYIYRALDKILGLDSQTTHALKRMRKFHSSFSKPYSRHLVMQIYCKLDKFCLANNLHANQGEALESVKSFEHDVWNRITVVFKALICNNVCETSENPHKNFIYFISNFRYQKSFNFEKNFFQNVTVGQEIVKFCHE